MTSASPLVRSVLIYGICLPLAVYLGYLLATPQDSTTIAVVCGVLFCLAIPFILRWHHFWLIASWNTVMVFFFLPGHPPFWMLLTALSFSVSFAQYIMNRRLKFLWVPSVARPLIFLTVVVLATAKLRGGIGLEVFGGSVVGGKRYVNLFCAVVGYFAITARRVPPKHAWLYVSLFVLGIASNAVGDLAPFIPSSFYPIFALFPTTADSARAALGQVDLSTRLITRWVGLSTCCYGLACLMLARYGVKEMFNPRRIMRLVVFAALAAGAMFGGFRSIFLLLLITFCIMFYLEGLLNSRLTPAFLLIGMVGVTLLIAFVDRLPLNMQRSLSVLPLNVNPIAKQDAQNTIDWRVGMWKDVLPEVPKYLIIGKGLAIDPAEMAAAMNVAGFEQADSLEGAEIAGDYHNGPLSLIIPFGLFGVGAFLWFCWAAVQVLYRNCKYGDPALSNMNRLLFAYFIARLLLFLFVFGGFATDFALFVGFVALSISLNGGVARKPVALPAQRVARRPQMHPALRRPLPA